MESSNCLKSKQRLSVSFHDPCFLGRQNGIISEPRLVLQQIDMQMVELPRHGRQSFCCGAGGAQVWKEEEHGTGRVNADRMGEVLSAGVETLVVGCPFCQIALNDAAKGVNSSVEIVDWQRLSGWLWNNCINTSTNEQLEFQIKYSNRKVA